MLLFIGCNFTKLMLVRLRKAIESCWYGGSNAAILLLPLAWLFGLLAAARRGFYHSGLLSRPALPVPVIVVGNLSVGGTGKSPVVGWLAQQLLDAGFKPGIVSRGYGGTHNSQPLLVDAQSDPAVVGDEPLMLAEQTGCPVCVCTDRVAAVKTVSEQRVNVVISDDGLQHYRMRRAVELIVIDGERGFGNGYLLPAGPLREPLARLEQADAVLVNGGSASITGIVFNLSALHAVPLDGSEAKPLQAFSGQRVWAVAGIGNPNSFYKQLSAAGIQVDGVAVPDHGVYPLETLTAKRIQPILMTHKDAVKYRSGAPENSWYVPVEVILANSDQSKLLELIRQRIDTN